MSTKLRLWKKQEKQIVKLLYRKGLLDFKLEQLYWESFHVLNIQKRKHGNKHKRHIYAPELYFSTIDYWGEGNEYSVVSSIAEAFYWDNIIDPEIYNVKIESSFSYNSRPQLINYLKTLPTKRIDSKINKVLKLNYNKN